MDKPTRQHTAGLEMAKEVIASEGMCLGDVPGMLDHLIDQSKVSTFGRPAVEELWDLVVELKKSGANTRPERHSNGFDQGMGFALEKILKRIMTLQ